MGKFGAAWVVIMTAVACFELAYDAAAAPTAKAVQIPQCKGVSLSASYLAEEKPGGGPGFLLTIRNSTAVPVTLPEPIPLSVHWYAQSQGRWLWRASSGSGGTLVNALRENGPLFASTEPVSTTLQPIHTIAPGETYTWSVFTSNYPPLQYRPGCEHCNFPAEHEFHAVLAYAYLPASAPPGFLHCGLRSQPVVMPPLKESTAVHNSTLR